MPHEIVFCCSCIKLSQIHCLTQHMVIDNSGRQKSETGSQVEALAGLCPSGCSGKELGLCAFQLPGDRGSWSSASSDITPASASINTAPWPTLTLLSPSFQVIQSNLPPTKSLPQSHLQTPLSCKVRSSQGFSSIIIIVQHNVLPFEQCYIKEFNYFVT